MKESIINYIITYINKNTNYDYKDINKISYGIEGLYLMITKLIIVFVLSLLLNIFKETILLFLVFGVIRFFGFGVHAKTSSQCLLYSLFLFILLPFIFYHITLNIYLEILLFIITSINLFIFAPSDTENRRFRDKKKYFIRKILTLIITFVYIFLYYYFNNKVFLISIIIQSIIVNPITYKIMGIDYHYIFGLNRNI